MSSDWSRPDAHADVKERLDATGLTSIGSTPEEFGAYLRSEIEKWGKVVRSVGMRVD